MEILRTIVAGLAENAMLFGISSFAYVTLRQWLAKKNAKSEEVILGSLFGATAIASMLVSLLVAPGVMPDAASITVALAAPFGGNVAASIAAALAAICRLWIGQADGFRATMEILAAGLTGLLLSETLRRAGSDRRLQQVLALAVALPLLAFIGFAFHAAPASAAGGFPWLLGVGVTGFAFVCTLLFGTLLLYWRKMSESLADSQRQFAALSANVPGMVFRCVVKPSGEIAFSYVSGESHDLLGIDPADIDTDSRGLLRMLHPEDAVRFRQTLVEAAGELYDWNHDYRVVRWDGSIRWLHGRAVARQSLNGEVVLCGAMIDVTRRKEREAELRRIQDRYRLLSDNISEVIQACAADGLLTFVSPSIGRWLGYAPSELEGQPIDGIVHPHDLERVRTARRPIPVPGEPIEIAYRARRKDGIYVPVEETYGASAELDSAGRRELVGVLKPGRPPEIRGEGAGGAREPSRAESIEEAKRTVIANLSHELRTPLNGVLGFTNLLLGEELPPEQRRYAAFVRNAGRSLVAILNNAVDLADAQAKQPSRETNFSVSELALSCNTVVWHAAREKNLELNFIMKPDVMDNVRGYPDRLRHVLLNLLGNAIRFTEKGSVSLTIDKGGDTWSGTILKFSVVDTGIGIAPEKQKLLFGDAGGESSAAEAGGGLPKGGLAVCKLLVEQMGGRISVKSTPDAGSDVSFTVPVQVVEVGAADRLPSGAPPAEARARILVAEDTPMNQELLVAVLTRTGYEVEVVADGVAALEAVRRRKFDLVLLDVHMPLLDGIATARAIRKLPAPTGTVPIIAVTAKALPAEIASCLAAGMNSHLAKPIDPVELLDLVEDLLTPAPARPKTSPPPRDETFAEAARRADPRRKRPDPDAMGMTETAMREIPERLERMLRQVGQRETLRKEAQALMATAEQLGLQDLIAQCRRLVDAPSATDDWQVGVTVENVKSAAERALAGMKSDRTQLTG